MKAYGWVIALGHLQHIVTVGHKHITPVAVNGHELVLALSLIHI